MNLTIVGYGHTRCGPEWGFATQGENFHRVYFVLGGDCRCTIHGETYFLQPGTIYILPRHIPYTMAHTLTDPLYVLWQHVKLTDLDIGQSPLVLPVSPESPVRHVLQAMEDISRGALMETLPKSGDPVATQLQALLAALFVLLDVQGRLFTPVNQRLSQVLQLVGAHPEHRYSVAELAAYAGLERSHFSRLFRQQFHISAQNYLIRTRLELGAKALLSGSSVGESAAISGYLDAKAFSRAFSDHYGIPPGQYQRTHILQP